MEAKFSVSRIFNGIKIISKFTCLHSPQSSVKVAITENMHPWLLKQNLKKYFFEGFPLVLYLLI